MSADTFKCAPDDALEPSLVQPGGDTPRTAEERERQYELVTRHLRQHCNDFRSAGEWLDGFKCAVEKDGFKCARDTLIEQYRNWYSEPSVDEQPGLHQRPTKAERIEWARRVLLLTWLATDDEAGTCIPEITWFQRWPYGNGEDVSDTQRRTALAALRIGFDDEPAEWDAMLTTALEWRRKIDEPLAKAAANEGDNGSLKAHGAADTEAVSTKLDDLPLRAKKAHKQYLEACEAIGKDKPTDREAYELLEKVYRRTGKLSELKLFSTWTSYLRQWRRATEQQKRKSRAGRAGEARAATVNELADSELPTDVRK